MRLTFPHVPRNGGELRIGIRDSCGSPGFLTTINNRIRSAIGDFVSHPAGDNQTPGPLCAESFFLRCILAPFDPASHAQGKIIMKPHVSRSICDFSGRRCASRRRVRFFDEMTDGGQSNCARSFIACQLDAVRRCSLFFKSGSAVKCNNYMGKIWIIISQVIN